MTRGKIAKRILVTNDDGIYAPGIKVLEQVAQELAEEVWTVAPEVNHSGAGHSLTIKRPLRVHELSEQRYAVDGTPTDAVLLGLQSIVPRPVDLVLSGVNRGGNLGEDVTYSGTVAAAMEATLLDVPAIALSQCLRNGHPVKWSTAERHAPDVIRQLVRAGWGKGVLINVNFPDRVANAVQGVQVVRQGRSKLGDHLVERIDPRGEPYIWIGGLKYDEGDDIGTDRGAVRAGAIAVTPIHLDMTHHAELARLISTLASSSEN
ncbi:MAG: 5'/3'-nucleotidase SurE [Geminicoccaceae bacterium]|nr:MAG: 5'/3'-nucleotidase SurE [Geminicoccaceae bacterium]